MGSDKGRDGRRSLRKFGLAALLLGTAAQSLAAAEPNREYDVIAQSALIGGMTVGGSPTRPVIDYGYANNGRGPKFHTELTLADDGLPQAMTTDGVNLLHVAEHETLTSKDGRLAWTSGVDKGEAASRGFYTALNGSPEQTAILARALLRSPTHSLPLLPGGQARIEKASELTVAANGQSRHVTLYLIDGLQIGPTALWLDDDRTLFALVQGSAVLPGTIAKGWTDVFSRLYDAQSTVIGARERKLAQELGRHPGRPVVFRHVDLFDTIGKRLRHDMRVTVDGERIRSVAPESATAIPTGAEIIDGRGKTLMPGLWDMHVHIQSDLDGALHMANGVTSARDMGNVMSSALAWRRDFGSGALIGPRLMLAGLVDGRSATSNNASIKVTNPAELASAVDLFAKNHYVELKIYSSFPPALVPLATREAKAHGLRAGGHVPAGMRMDDAIADGFTDVSHLNFALLNFLDDETQKGTNTLARVLAPAQHGADIDLGSPKVKATIATMVEKHVALDATAIVLELLFTSQRGVVPDYAKPFAAMLPPQLLRDTMSGGLATMPEQLAQYRRSFDHALALLEKMHEAGVVIVPGTDGLAGLCLVHELELYRRAGMSTADVLQIATLVPARMMKKDAELGSVTAGKLADLILVDGDPTKDVGRLRNLSLVVKGGIFYDPRQINRAIGIAAH